MHTITILVYIVAKSPIAQLGEIRASNTYFMKGIFTFKFAMQLIVMGLC